MGGMGEAKGPRAAEVERERVARGELSAAELREVRLHLAPYAGYPRTAPLLAVVEECIAAQGKGGGGGKPGGAGGESGGGGGKPGGAGGESGGGGG